VTPELWLRVATKLLIAASYLLEALSEFFKLKTNGVF
jgi:hypothetical protein